MRFMLPLATACLVATVSSPVQAQQAASTSAKPASEAPSQKPNKPASYFLEEVTPAAPKAPAVSKDKAKKQPAAKTATKAPANTTAAASPSALQTKINKQEPISKHFQQGLVMQSMGMNDYAITEYRDALKEDPKFISTYNNLAQCLINRGKDEDKAEALKLLNEAVKIDPNNIGTLHALAVLKEANKDETGAVETYKKILAVQPLNMRAIQNLSELYFRLDKKDDAKNVIETALKQNPPEEQRTIFQEALKNLQKPANKQTASK